MITFMEWNNNNGNEIHSVENSDIIVEIFANTYCTGVEKERCLSCMERKKDYSYIKVRNKNNSLH